MCCQAAEGASNHLKSDNCVAPCAALCLVDVSLPYTVHLAVQQEKSGEKCKKTQQHICYIFIYKSSAMVMISFWVTKMCLCEVKRQ